MATVYVSPTGDNSRTYAQAQSSSTPWLTLAKCNTSATSGDTIIMMAGTHTNSGNNIGYAIPGKNFIIQGASAPTMVNGVMTWTTIIDANGGQWGIGPDGTSDITLSISNIEFRNYTCAGGGTAYTFGITGSAGNPDITTLSVTNCKFKNWKTALTYGGGGVITYGWRTVAGTARVWTITNNIFENITDNNAATSFGTIFGGRNLFSGDSVTITNNSFYLPETVSVNVLDALVYFSTSSSGTTTLTMKNNVIYSATSFPFYKGANQFSVATVNNNDFYNISSPPSGTGNITSDPLYVDQVNSNYNLRPSSPAIDSGSTA